MTDPFLVLILLFGTFFLADYPLQGDFLAKAKNPTNPIPGVPWKHAMSAHASIHGMFVAVITGIWWLFVLEFIVHFETDVAKCRGTLTFEEDQLIHYISRALWWIIWLIVVYI